MFQDTKVCLRAEVLYSKLVLDLVNIPKLKQAVKTAVFGKNRYTWNKTDLQKTTRKAEQSVRD